MSAHSITIIDRITSFLQDIDLVVIYEVIQEKTFLPGLCIRNGALIIDREKLLYPGDILHEAGHLAVMPAIIRVKMNGDLPNDNINQGGELMAIAWSYAACIHLKIDPYIVFHAHGYKGGANNLVENFRAGRNIGLPLLQWNEMAYDDKKGKELGVKAFPHMHSWLCIKNKYEEVDLLTNGDI